ncbi:MAG: hypothetical protein NTY09_11610 [bacterium]|nr:hypothetical protein [bacterium]
MEKFIKIILCLLLILAIAGCPKKNTDSDHGSSGSDSGSRNGDNGGGEVQSINDMYDVCSAIFQKLPEGIVFTFRCRGEQATDDALEYFMTMVYTGSSWDYGVSDYMDPVGIDRDEFDQVEFSVELLSNRNFYYAEIYKFPEDFISEDTIDIDENNFTLKEVGNGFLWEAATGETSYGFLGDYLIFGEGEFVEDIIRCLDDDCRRQPLAQNSKVAAIWDMFGPGFLFVISTIGIGLDNPVIASMGEIGGGGENSITSNGTFFERVDDSTVRQTIIYSFDTAEEAQDAKQSLLDSEQASLDAEQMNREIEDSQVEDNKVVITVLSTLESIQEDNRDSNGNGDDNEGSGRDSGGGNHGRGKIDNSDDSNDGHTSGKRK